MGERGKGRLVVQRGIKRLRLQKKRLLLRRKTLNLIKNLRRRCHQLLSLWQRPPGKLEVRGKLLKLWKPPYLPPLKRARERDKIFTFSNFAFTQQKLGSWTNRKKLFI